MHHSFCGT